MKSSSTGKNRLGDIALDDIAFHPGPCTSAPQAAASQQGDCDFELDECGWTNAGVREGIDEIDWTRVPVENNRHQPLKDHTTSTNKGHVMIPSRSAVQLQRPGDRAWLVSRLFTNNSFPRCLTFWYYMNEPIIDPAGPGLGSLKIYTRKENLNPTSLKPVWRLQNHQSGMWMMGQVALEAETSYRVIFEGLWGSSRSVGSIAIDDISFYDGNCNNYPVYAVPSALECSFDRDTCLWRNLNQQSEWRLATASRRPANLLDHTFGAPSGYVFFDVFNQADKEEIIRMKGPDITLNDDGHVCLTFWFSPFGADGSTQLRILTSDNSSTESEIWNIRLMHMESYSSVSSDWHFGQVQLGKVTIVMFEGRASNGGFAVDDIAIYEGSCSNRPEKFNSR